jgi:WD40 repeat protein
MVTAVNGPDPMHQRVAWGTDGRSLAMGGAFPASLVIWDPIEQKMAKRFDTNGRGLTHIAWSPNGRRVAAATFDGDLRMWNVEGDEPPQSIAAHHGQMAECCWSADGKRLASGGEDNLVRIWNAETGQQLNRLPGHRAMVSSVDWSSKEDWIVSGARDGTVGLWRPDERVDALLIRGRETSAWSPDGSRIASNDPRHKGGETYSILDSRSGQTVKVLQSAFHGSMQVFAWSPNGNMIAGAEGHGAAFVWDAASGKLLRSIPKAHAPNENGVAETRGIAWSPDSRQFATCGQDRLVKIWDPTGKLLRTFADHATGLGSVRWSPDGKLFASADWGRDIKIRATDTWQTCWEIDREPASVRESAGGDYIIAWGPDSQRLASVNTSGQIVVWKLLEPKKLEKLWAIDAHTSTIRSIAWSSDGRRIASGSEDRTAKIWDAETGRELLTLEGHNSMVKSVVWSPDNRRLTSADEASLYIWDATEAYADQQQLDASRE